MCASRGSLSTSLLICTSALTLNRLIYHALDSSMSNPGVPILASVLCAGGVAWERVKVGRLQPQGEPNLKIDHNIRPIWRHLLCVIGGALYLWSLLRHISHYPLRSLSLSHTHVLTEALGTVTIEGVGLWLLWWGWWSQQSQQWRSKLTIPLLFGVFALPCELWLRQLDEPLQRVGATLGAWLVEQVSALSTFWGASPISIRFWNPYTFYSDQFYLIINETCSGVNILISSALYATGFCWLTRGRARDAVLLALYSIPLSLMSNACRISMIFLLGHHGGVELAMGPWHELSAYIMQLPLVVALAYLSPNSQLKSGSQRS